MTDLNKQLDFLSDILNHWDLVKVVSKDSDALSKLKEALTAISIIKKIDSIETPQKKISNDLKKLADDITNKITYCYVTTGQHGETVAAYRFTGPNDVSEEIRNGLRIAQNMAYDKASNIILNVDYDIFDDDMPKLKLSDWNRQPNMLAKEMARNILQQKHRTNNDQI